MVGSDVAILRSDVESLIFGDEVPTGTAECEALNKAVRAAMLRWLPGTPPQDASDFCWFLLRQILADPPAVREREKLLIAARHLLLLGDYERSEAVEADLAPFGYDKVVAGVSKTLARENLPPSEALNDRKTLRHAYAAVASGIGNSRTAFTGDSGTRNRRPVVAAVSDEVTELLASKRRVGEAWREFQRERSVADNSRFIPAVAGGWGPPRNSWSHDLRPDHATLNSRDDHPYLGDSSNFFRACEVNEAGDLMTLPIPHLAVEPGRTYRGWIWIGNDADPAQADAIARNVRVKVNAPARFTGSARLSALIHAEGVEHSPVWDSVVIALPDPESSVALRIVKDSAALRDSRDGQVLSPLDPNAMFRGPGATIGIEGRTDGVLPPEGNSLVFVTFDFVLDKPDFELSVDARPYLTESEIQEPYRDRIELEPSDIIDVRVHYKNTGTVQQDNVRLELMQLPPALHYYGTTVEICNATTGGEWETFNADNGRFGWYSLGAYTPGSDCYVRFRIKAHKTSLYEYRQGVHWLDTSKLIRVFTENGSKSAGLTTLVFANTRPLLPHAES